MLVKATGFEQPPKLDKVRSYVVTKQIFPSHICSVEKDIGRRTDLLKQMFSSLAPSLHRLTTIRIRPKLCCSFELQTNNCIPMICFIIWKGKNYSGSNQIDQIIIQLFLKLCFTLKEEYKRDIQQLIRYRSLEIWRFIVLSSKRFFKLMKVF